MPLSDSLCGMWLLKSQFRLLRLRRGASRSSEELSDNEYALVSLGVGDDKSMHPRVCCLDLTYPKVACFGGITDNGE